MSSILITDALLRKSLVAVRSLGRKGITVFASEKNRFTPASFSKYCSKGLVSPDPTESPGAYMDWLLDTLKKFRVGAYLPMDDATMHMAVKHHEEIKHHTALLIPPLESYTVAEDKYRAALLASAAGIDIPKSWLPQPEEIDQFAVKLDYPVVIKPRRASGSRGIRIVRHSEELIAEYRQIHQLYPNPMIQEFIPSGERVDVAFLFDREGELKAYFVQREIRHYPIEIGPSTVQESLFMPELVDRLLAVMKLLPWTGVIEFELMRDRRDGKLKFMEINPRFWNSLHLAVQSGIDFPWAYYLLAQGKEVPKADSYLIGRKARNLLPGDLLHFLSNPNRFHLDPPLFRKGMHDIDDDILSWQDPLPTLGFFAASLTYLFSKKRRVLFFKR